jgi:sugar/nucleoside kinase (ribokinase family)
MLEAALDRLRQINPSIMLSITAGKEGSWSWDGSTLSHLPAHPVAVSGTAGAGDAHLAGTVTGIAAGLGLHAAAELGALVAGLAVTSPHTIHKGIDLRALRQFARDIGARISRDVWRLLGG